MGHKLIDMFIELRDNCKGLRFIDWIIQSRVMEHERHVFQKRRQLLSLFTQGAFLNMLFSAVTICQYRTIPYRTGVKYSTVPSESAEESR